VPNAIVLVAGDPAGADLAWKHFERAARVNTCLGLPHRPNSCLHHPLHCRHGNPAYLLTLIAAAAVAVWLLASRTVSVTVYVPALA
jgi:hypothetical protein